MWRPKDSEVVAEMKPDQAYPSKAYILLLQLGDTTLLDSLEDLRSCFSFFPILSFQRFGRFCAASKYLQIERAEAVPSKTKMQIHLASDDDGNNIRDDADLSWTYDGRSNKQLYYKTTTIFPPASSRSITS